MIEPGGGCAADRITVTGLRVHGRHGVLAAERELGQEFVIDATVWLDTTPAAATDDVTATVHYGDLAEHLAKIVSGEPVKLIETLAHRLAGACLAHPRVRSAEVTVHKPAAPIPLPFADVAVTVTRRQSQSQSQSQPQPQAQWQWQWQRQPQAQPTGRPTDAGAGKTREAAE